MTSEPPHNVEEPAPRMSWLRRSRNDRYLAGIAGGLGESLQFDPLLARVGLVGLTMFAAYAGDGLHPLVLIPYFLAWALVPQRGDRALLLRVRERSALQELGGALVLVVIGILALSNTDYAFAVGLAALALALFSDHNRTSLPTRPTGSASDVQPRVEEVDGPSGRSGNLGRLGVGLFSDRPERPPRREPALWPLTLSLLVLVAIISILVDRFSDPGINPALVVNMALIAIGSVLLLSFWRGRARVTIVWALLLMPFWIAFSVADIGRFAGQGSVRYAPTSADADGQLDYELGYGRLNINLEEFEFSPGSETTMKVGVTAGAAYIRVPRDVTVLVKGKIGLGEYGVYEPTYWNGSKTLMNGEIRRTYAAAGVDCERWEIPEPELSGVAQRSGVEVGDGENLQDAIVDAGFARPEFLFSGQSDQWFQSETGEGEHRIVETDYYLVQTRFGSLCVPEPPPSNPAILVIEPTIGVGELEIYRVDIS